MAEPDVEEQEPNRSARESAAGANGPRRRTLSWQAVAVLVVIVPVMCVTMFYWPQVRNWVALERWSEAGPRNLVGATIAALVSSDESALRQVLGDRPDLTLVTTDSGEIAAVKLGGGPSLPVGVWPLHLPDVRVRELEYDLAGGSVAAHVHAAEGPELIFVLRKHGGRWRIERIMGPPSVPHDGANARSPGPDGA